MTGKTHKVMGICVGIAFTYWGLKTQSNPMFAVTTLAAAAGAMLPDIDHNRTRLGAKRKLVVDTATKVLSVLFVLVVAALCVMLIYAKMYYQLTVMLLLIILPMTLLSVIAQVPFVRRALKFTTRHRGIMHTLAIPLLLILGFMFIGNDAVRFGLLAMAAGYLSHLLLDCLNTRGCPILWPIYSKNIALLSIRTGSAWEYIVSYTLAAAVLALVFAVFIFA